MVVLVVVGVVPVAVPLFDLPFAPVTVPLAVVVPFPLLVAVPLAVVVAPRGPVTVPDSAVPVRVLVTVPVADAVCPLAEVAVAVPVAVLPFWVTVVEAVPPRLVVTVCCADAERAPIVRARAASVAIFMGIPWTEMRQKKPGPKCNPTLVAIADLSHGWVFCLQPMTASTRSSM